MRPNVAFPGRQRIPAAGPPGAVAGEAYPPPGALREEFHPTLAFVGLAIYLWVVHSYKLPIGAVGIGLGLLGLVFQPHRLRIPAPLVWFGVFILWAFLTAPLAQSPDLTREALTSYSKVWLIFLVACNVSHDRRGLYVLIITWLAFYALYPVRGTFFNFLIGHQYWGRYAWNFSFENPNDLAALTLPIFAMAVAVFQGEREKRWIRLSALAGIIVLPSLVFLTQSRGGILAMFTMGMLILVLYRKRARAIAFASLVVGVVALLAPPEVWTRLEGLTNASTSGGMAEVDEEGSAAGRWEIWRIAGAIISDHPVTGVGLGGYPAAHAGYARQAGALVQARGFKDTHSLYLNAAAETGFVGLAILCTMFISALSFGLRTARRLDRVDPIAARQARTLVIGLVALLQAGIFATLHRVAFVYLYLAVLVSAAMILAETAQQSSSTAASRRIPLRLRGGVTAMLGGNAHRWPEAQGLPPAAPSQQASSVL